MSPLEELPDCALRHLRRRYQMMRAIEETFTQVAVEDDDAALFRETWSRRNRLSGLLAHIMRIERERSTVQAC